MSSSRFKAILANLQLSKSKDWYQQDLDFIDALNAYFQNAINPSDFLYFDESMCYSWFSSLSVTDLFNTPCFNSLNWQNKGAARQL